MPYSIEHITEESWESIRKHSDILERAATHPKRRVINNVTGSFLVELNSETNRHGWTSNCVYVMKGRSLRVALSDPSYGKFQALWTAWDGIEPSDITELNAELIKATQTLYPFTAHHLSVRVLKNPFEQVPKATIVGLFDANVGSWYASKRYRLIVKRTKELKEGINSPFMWRFYWTKWKGVAYTSVEQGLIKELAYLLRQSNHFQILLNHLDDGGEGLSEDSKRVLNHLRNRKRLSDLLNRVLPKWMVQRLGVDDAL